MSHKLLGEVAKANVAYIKAKNELSAHGYLPWQDYVKLGIVGDLPQLAYREQNKSTLRQADAAVLTFQREYQTYGYRAMTTWLFGNSTMRNSWFETAYINVYLRREAPHRFGSIRTLTIDLANVNSKAPGKGYYGHLLQHLELVAKALGHFLFIENADAETYGLYLEKGFTQIAASQMHQVDNCFFKEPK